MANGFTENQRATLRTINRRARDGKPVRWADTHAWGQGAALTLNSLARRGAIEPFAGRNEDEIKLTETGKRAGLVI